MKRNPKVKFPTHSQFDSKHLLDMVAKTTNRYVLPLLTKCETTSIIFDFWMFRTGYDTFYFVVNFIDDIGTPVMSL